MFSLVTLLEDFDLWDSGRGNLAGGRISQKKANQKVKNRLRDDLVLRTR